VAVISGMTLGTASGEVPSLFSSAVAEVDWQPANAKAVMMTISINFLGFISSSLRWMIHHLVLPP
jgi:hypothetical protein